MNQILVVGATGNIGSKVVSQLAAKGAPVRALSRNPETAHFPSSVEVVRGDITAPESLDACLPGIDAVFMVWTAPPATFADVLGRIARHARRLVFLSAPLKTQHPLFQQPNPLRTITMEFERLIEASGIEWTFLRPGMLASNALLWWAPQCRRGDEVRWPCLSAPTAPIDERDIAAVAVRALLEEGHASAEYVLTGPESLTQSEQISTIGRAIGRALRPVEIPAEQWRLELPFGQVATNMLLNAWIAAIGQPAHMTNTVAELTGRPARTVFEWATTYADNFQVSTDAAATAG